MDDRSERNLVGVHHDLAAIVRKAHEIYTDESKTFIVTEGLRSKERQAQLVKAGASWTMNSKHLTGRAVDVAAKVAHQIRWDWPLYEDIAVAFKEAAWSMEIDIVWGGDWKVRDGPHFELADVRRV